MILSCQAIKMLYRGVRPIKYIFWSFFSQQNVSENCTILKNIKWKVLRNALQQNNTHYFLKIYFSKYLCFKTNSRLYKIIREHNTLKNTSTNEYILQRNKTTFLTLNIQFSVCKTCKKYFIPLTIKKSFKSKPSVIICVIYK